MKFGVFLQHLQMAAKEQDCSLPDLFRKVKQLGYDYVNMDCQDASEELLHALDAAGLRVWEIYDNFRWAQNPEDFNDFRLIKAAGLMRSTHLLPVPGLYSGNADRQAEELDRMVQGLSAFVREAEKHGMICGMEDYDHLLSPIRTIAGIRHFQERIPALKTFFDTGNFFISCEDCLEAFAAFRHNTVSVHMKDRTMEPNGGTPKKRTDGSLMYPCATGSGIMPLRTIVKELEGQEFDGVYAAEFFDSDNYTRDLEKSAHFLQELRSII